MAYDMEFLKVSWLFRIASTDEIAVTSLNFADPLEPSGIASVLNDYDIEVLGAALLGRMAILLGGAPINWATYSQLVGVRVAGVLTTGTEVDPAKQFDDLSPATGGSINVIPQASVVLSTRSGESSGTANFGRMYLPHCQWPLSTGSPRGNPSFISTVADAAETFVEGCNADMMTSLLADPRARIMTQAGAGVSKRVTQIAMGDITDTQRRRRNQLPEIYAFRSISV